MKDYYDSPRLLEAMKRAASRARPWTFTIFRSAPPKWAAGPEMLTGVGSMKSGAWFNAPGSFPAIYGSTTPELAMIESLAYQRRAKLPVERAMPLVFKAISVQVERCLDLTDTAVLSDMRLSLDQLRTDPWWVARARGEESLTQAIGRAAHTCGVESLLAASSHALDQGINVIVLPDHVRSPNEVRMVRHPYRPPRKLPI